MAAVLFASAYFIVPAIGRSIDRSANADSINCGLQYNSKSGDLGVGFTAKNTDNVKDHSTAGTVNGHDGN